MTQPLRRVAFACLLLWPLLADAISLVGPTLSPSGPATPILINRTITASSSVAIGSYQFTLLPAYEVDLVWNVTGSVSGNITFTIAEADPLNPASPITGGTSVSSAAISAAGTGYIAINPCHSTAETVSWVVAGGSPSIAGVNLTLVYKILTAPAK